ncbi:MAG: autotransporter-associated beta strand repeat-containing protein [Rariglobus sp.]
MVFGAIVAPSVQAANIYWDADTVGAGDAITGTGLGGGGSWNNSTSVTPLLNWWPGSGTTDQSWVSANFDTAVFSGSAGTVALTDAITVGGLRFNTQGYVISTGANTLSFGAGTDTITLNNISSATITGAVGGTGSVVLTRTGTLTASLALNGTSTTGWSGSTTINSGATLALSGSNQALVSTSGITLNGGNLTLTNTNNTEGALNRVNNGAAITSNGGAITYTNTSTGTAYAETLGVVALNSGLLNLTSTTAVTSGTEVLTLSGLTQSNAGSIAISAGGGLNTGFNQIKVTGATSTTAGQIIGPWATVGTSSGAQTDYAVYSGTNILAANIATSAETTWTTAANSYSLAGGTALTGTRNIAALRYTGAAATLALGTSFLETGGILNGGSGLLTVTAGSGGIRQQGTGAANLYITAGSNAIAISAPIVNNTGALTVVKNGTSALSLSGTNTFSGGLILNAGTLNINSATALGGAAGTFTINGGTINNNSGAAITLANNNAQAWNAGFIYGGTNALNLGTGAVSLSGTDITATINGNSTGALTVGGDITGSSNLFKAGNGTLILGGNNSAATGATTINAGVLQYNAANSILGSGQNVTLNAGGTAAFSYAFDQSTLTGRLVSGSKGTVALAADSATALDFTASGLGNLSLGAATGSWTYTGTLTPANSIYRLGGGGGNLIFDSALSGSNSLIVGGNGSGGTVTLATAAAHTGGTTVTGAIGNANVAVNGASLLQTNILASSSTTPFGTGPITLNNGGLGLGTAAALTSGQSVNASGYDLTFNGQNSINLAVGGGSTVTFAANTLTRSNHGVLLLNPSAGATLGSTEIVTVASGAPVVSNGIVSPYYIDGTNKNFLTYVGGGVGFQSVTSSGDLSAGAASNSLLTTSGNMTVTTWGGNRTINSLKLNNTGSNATYALGASATDVLNIQSGGLIINAPSGTTTTLNGTTINFGLNEGVVGSFGGSLASNVSIIGSGGFTIYGNSQVTFSGGLKTTGGITIAGGTVLMGANAAVSMNPNNIVTISRGAVLGFNGNGRVFQALGLEGEGKVTYDSSVASTNTGSGPVTIDGWNTTSTSIFSGLLTDGGSGSGYSISLLKAGMNTQVLTGSNNYSSGTAISGGTLALDFTAAGAPVSNIINNTANYSALTLSLNGRLNVIGNSVNSQQFNGLTVGGGYSTIELTSGGGGLSTLALGSTLARSTGGTLNVVDATGGNVSTGAAVNLTNGVLTQSSTTPTAFAAINGTDWATVSNGKVVGLTGSVTGTGNYTAANNVDVTNGDSVADVTVNSLRFKTASAALTLSGVNIVNTGGILVTADSTAASISGGTLKSNTGNELVIINNGQLSVGSVIANGAAASALTLSGLGTTTLNGVNTYTGATYINSGTVVAGVANAFGTTAGTINLNGGTLQSGVAGLSIGNAISLNNFTTISGSNSLTFTGTLTNGGRANNILTVNNSAATTFGAIALGGSTGVNSGPNALTFAGSGDVAVTGVVSGAASLTYAGSATLTLSNAASTATGVTTVKSGTLSVGTLAAGGANSGIGAATNVASNIVLDGGTLKYTGATVSTDRLFSVGGAGGTLDASGLGALTFTNAGALGFANTSGTRTLTLGGTNADANTLNSLITDAYGIYATSLAKSGAGKWVLSGANTYTGGTTVNAGTLVFGNSFTMSGANAVSVAATGTAGVNYATVSSTVGTLTFGGTLGINLTASLAGGESFTLFSANGGALAGDFGSTAGNVSITGGYIASLTNNGSGIWTGTDTNGSGLSFTFSASGVNAGLLTVSAVPEPATYAAIFGVLALAGAALRRRR